LGKIRLLFCIAGRALGAMSPLVIIDPKRRHVRQPFKASYIFAIGQAAEL
jgi:hypothetical protein